MSTSSSRRAWLRHIAIQVGIRVGCAIFAVTVSLLSIKIWEAIGTPVTRVATQLLLKCIPASARPLSFTPTFDACGFDGNSHGFEASDGATLVQANRRFDSDEAAAHELEFRLHGATILERQPIEDEHHVLVGERVLADFGAIDGETQVYIVYREDQQIRSLLGQSVEHVTAFERTFPMIYPGHTLVRSRR